MVRQRDQLAHIFDHVYSPRSYFLGKRLVCERTQTQWIIISFYHFPIEIAKHIFPSKWRTIKPSYFQTNPFEEILHAGSSGIFHNYHDIPSVGWCACAWLKKELHAPRAQFGKPQIGVKMDYPNLWPLGEQGMIKLGAPKSQFASDAHPSGESQSWCCRTSRFATTPILRFYVVYPASWADLALLFILLVMYISWIINPSKTSPLSPWVWFYLTSQILAVISARPPKRCRLLCFQGKQWGDPWHPLVNGVGSWPPQWKNDDSKDFLPRKSRENQRKCQKLWG